MNLTEARKVAWMAPHRPLGELLDEGFADRTRLEWATKNASDPRVQQAATVLLAWLNSRQATGKRPTGPTLTARPALPKLVAPMTLNQARATIWPFQPFKGQSMGPLVETRQLSMKDLGYAIDNAWEKFVRDAAIVLMAVRMHQQVQEPAKPLGFLNVVSGKRTFSERKQLQLSMIEGIIMGLALATSIGLGIAIFVNQSNNPSHKTVADALATPGGIIGLAIGAILVIIIPWLATRLLEIPLNKMDDRIERYRIGQEGENRAIDQMRITLNGEWTLFRNVVLPGRGGDIDAVLVGPTGVWALEIKTLSGSHRNIGDVWEYKAGNKWVAARANPSRQVHKEAINLGEFLRADGLKLYVKEAVIWANPDSPLEVDNPTVSVWTLPRLADELANRLQGKRIPEADCEKIVEKLTKLVIKKK